MFTVTENAQQKIAEHFLDKAVMPIRIFLNQGGCGGPQMAMALDEKKETDSIFKFAGVEYLVDTTFFEEAKPIAVDFIETGFKVTSRLELTGCSSCSTEGSCCS